MSIFVENVKKNFHFVLAFSPVGSKVREIVRKYPNLINCSTVDVYETWP
jgi:dynein heavy chain